MVRNGAAAAPAAAAAAPETPDLSVMVENPSQQGEGMSAYMAYTVTTISQRPEFGLGKTSVLRRYSDFDWLREVLVQEQEGQIVPVPQHKPE